MLLICVKGILFNFLHTCSVLWRLLDDHIPTMVFLYIYIPSLSMVSRDELIMESAVAARPQIGRISGLKLMLNIPLLNLGSI